MILTYIEWRNEAPWWFLADRETLTAIDEYANEWHRGKWPPSSDDEVWRRTGNIKHPHLLSPAEGGDVSEGWHQIIPPTDEEIAAFCEAADVVRPGPDASELEVRSFASHLVVWLAEQRAERSFGPRVDG